MGEIGISAYLADIELVVAGGESDGNARPLGVYEVAFGERQSL